MKLQEKTVLGRRAFGFNLYRDIPEREYPVIPVDVSVVERTDMDKSLFDLIFSVNPITRLPQGDVAMYLSEQTHPDVKRFIEMELLKPNSSDSDASAADFSGLSDDDIVEFTRGANESISAYRDRLFETLKSERYKVSSSTDDSTK